jgi:hypothetical protein
MSRVLRAVTEVGRTMLARPGRDERPLDLFLRVTGVLVVLVCLVGGAWGFERGLSYPPTLWAAVIEGGVIFAFLGLLPAVLVGAVVGGCHWLRWHR